MNSPNLTRQLVPAAAAGLGLSLLSALPAGAHGMADGGLISGATHPLLGLDHLLLLVGVGALSSYVGATVLLFALAGGLIGALVGSSGGQLPAAEVLAALSVSALGLVTLQLGRMKQRPALALVGSLAAAAVAVHALLHGQEAPAGHAAWWLGALVASALVVGITHLALRRLALRWTLVLAAALSLAGGVLALAPLA
jgi:urease accessory protein